MVRETKQNKDGKIRLARAKSAFRAAPAFVMVEPQLGENIGAAARAMLNFGLKDLIIVNPRDGWPNEKATAMASGAAFILEEARIVQTTAEAVGDCNAIFAMTARPRECLLPAYAPREAAMLMKSKIAAGERCAVMLGPERTGLSNEDIASATAIVSIAVNPAFASLNVAQAAVVMAYEWALAAGFAPPPADLDAAPRASLADFDGLMAQLFDSLDAARYFYPPERRDMLERKIRTAFARADLTEGEVRTLRGVIKALVNPRG